ncbi:MAG TPA: hypothetical protein VGT61_09340 [Thermomicrobiales bacterium]|jgi:hypothetical protein|nr:hypothetical protein [Thermomicrobiales bacterium]
MTDSLPDVLTLDAARFLIASLSLPDDPESLATGLNRIDRDEQSAVFAMQMESSVGPAAFLVYVYETSALGKRGREVAKRHAGDLRTLQLAQARGVPGPRLVASGELNGNQFILATDPQTFAALADETVTAPPTTPTFTIDPADAPKVRREAADRILSRLKDAEHDAGRWLAAVGSGAEDPASLELDDVETELALYLLGPTGIRNVLRLANLVLEKGQAGSITSNRAAAGTEPAAEAGTKAPTPIRPGVVDSDQSE